MSTMKQKLANNEAIMREMQRTNDLLKKALDALKQKNRKLRKTNAALLDALGSLDLSFDRVQPPEIQDKIDAAIALAKAGPSS